LRKHQAVKEAGYEDIILDFSSCSAAFAGPMLALCAQVMKLRASRIDFALVLPADPRLARLFYNANWAHFLQPEKHSQSVFKGYTQIPTTLITTGDDQYQAVNRIVNAILGAIPDIERTDFAALEWSINEITDNVLVHANSPIGGLVQVSTFQKNRKTVEYIVADAGVGIPATLREGHPELTSDADALDRAIREGVTRDKAIGQGNGLFGSSQICSQSGGFINVISGYAKLAFAESSGLHITAERIPYEGTLVIAQIDFSVPGLLQEALRMGGRVHSPTDFVETHYEQAGTDHVLVLMRDESESFGSRTAGTPVRNRLSNLIRMCSGQRIHIDFSDVPLISSSFADEVFGKLFAELGPLTFMQSFEFRNTGKTVRQLIDRAIAQRMATHDI
jgi:anti-sigma regulatory factor (Ser/Thr protein kinase)